MSGKDSNVLFVWKRKPLDVLLSLIYFLSYIFLIHVISSLRHSFRYHSSFFQSVSNPWSIFLSFFITTVFLSPVYVYFRKVPAQLLIHSKERLLEIQKRKRTLRYDLDRTRFYLHTTSLFVIMEIHASFENSRGVQMEKMGTSVVVPRWGLSLNQKRMEEIAQNLRESGVGEITHKRTRSIWDYFYD